MNMKLTGSIGHHNTGGVPPDLSYLRLADFLEICYDGCVASTKILRSTSTTDKLIRNEAVHKVYSAFRKFELKETIEASKIFIAGIDCVMSCITNGLSNQPVINEVDSSQLVRLVKTLHLNHHLSTQI